MNLSALVVFIFYGSIVFSVIAGISRLATYANAPLHLKWELYQGSSVYELSDWWTRPHIGFRSKLKTILPDILLLRQYYQQNRSFWYALYPFHIGVYLLVLWHIWIFIVPMVAPVHTSPLAGLVWGHVATGLTLIGGAGILGKRLTNEKLRIYYPAIHYLKWVFILITLAGGFYAVYLHFGNYMPDVLTYIKDQLAFHWEKKFNPPLLPALHVLAVSIWLIYLPFSHMVQLFSRYYHELRWDHVPNLRGSTIERTVNRLLERRLSWSASHIQPARTWRQATQQLPGRSRGVLR